jgi:RNA polymerase sigma-32 factor
MLGAREEYMLARRGGGDREATHALVTSHLRLVVKIAMGYRRYGLPISEVISEGNVGLMKALKRFEPEKGFRFSTYARWWIKASIQEYILRSWSLVKMGTTAKQKKLFFHLREAKRRISALDEDDMQPEQVKTIAQRLGVTETDVIYMNRPLGGDASLNAPIREDDHFVEWQDLLVDERADQEMTLVASAEFDNRRSALASALSVLNDRERRIFEARRLAENPITLKELAREFGMCGERVRQIEVRSVEKVQKAMKNLVVAMETRVAVGYEWLLHLLPRPKKVPMDVSLWIHFAPTERCERRDARRAVNYSNCELPGVLLREDAWNFGSLIDCPKRRAANAKLPEVS